MKTSKTKPKSSFLVEQAQAMGMVLNGTLLLPFNIGFFFWLPLMGTPQKRTAD